MASVDIKLDTLRDTNLRNLDTRSQQSQCRPGNDTVLLNQIIPCMMLWRMISILRTSTLIHSVCLLHPLPLSYDPDVLTKSLDRELLQHKYRGVERQPVLPRPRLSLAPGPSRIAATQVHYQDHGLDRGEYEVTSTCFL